MSRQLKGVAKLPESELAVMQLIWDMTKSGGPVAEITAGNMLERYPEQIGHLKLTTVLTLISRLINKGFVKAEKSGRAYCYMPLVDEDGYKQMAAADFVKTVYKNDTRGLISALVTDGNLTAGDIDELMKMLGGKNGKGES